MMIDQRQSVEELLQAARVRSGSAAADSSMATITYAGPTGRFRPGDVIARRFTVVRYIARGGMGEVYEVQDALLQGVHVALKVILPEIAGDVHASRRFEQEVLLARKVVHRNLCPIYDIAHCDEPAPPFLFFTMKLLEGETLSSRLKGTRLFTRTEKQAIFAQMVSAVAAMHAAGVIHRDLKPNNVMLDETGTELCVSIMDFGLARLGESEATMLTRGVAGTPGYMARELFYGATPCEATDLYALGVLLHQVLTGVRPPERPLAMAAGAGEVRSAALEAADVPQMYIHAVREFLADDPARRCAAFEQVHAANRTTPSGESLLSHGVPQRRVMTRRQFAVSTGAAACAAVGGVAWKWDRIDDMMHPLPAKRFVALLDWPWTGDAKLEPSVAAVMGAIGAELARAEAFDHNLFVIPHHIGRDVSTPAQLNEVRESLGANLILSASGVPGPNELRVLLRVLDASATRTLRQKMVSAPVEKPFALPQKAVRVAAELLNIRHYEPNDKRTQAGTSDPEAYAAFQSAETAMKLDNDAGLDEAIGKYKQAIELDPRFALAQTKLSWAYLRSYGLNGEGAALELARANCQAAIRTDPNLVQAHLGLASVYQQTGNSTEATREISKALSLDPANPHTLLYQAKFYTANEQWDKADSTFKRVLDIRPNYWLAYNELGMNYSKQGKYEDSLTQFRAASMAAPRNALALANIGQVYLQLGRWTDAIQSLTASYSLRANDEAAIGQALAFRMLGDMPKAIASAEDAVKLNPTVPEDWIELGDCYLRMRDGAKRALLPYARARDIQLERVRNEPKNGPAWMLLSLCQALAHDTPAAESSMRKTGSFGANDLESQLVKLRIFLVMHRLEESITTLSEVTARGATVFQLQAIPEITQLRTVPELRTSNP